MKPITQLNVITLALLTALHINAFAGCVQWPASVFTPVPNPITHKIAPDYGLYWFKSAGNREQVMRAFTPPTMAAQFANGQLNTLPQGMSLASARNHYIQQLEKAGFFDPAKPTLIFIHGNQAGAMLKRDRVDFCYTYKLANGRMFTSLNTRNAWKDWNIGLFYWTPFADDVPGKGLGNFIKAITYPEMKIYSSQSHAGMSWSYLNAKGKQAFCYPGQKQCARLPTNRAGQPVSVSELAYMAYANAFPPQYNQPIRIVGQSLGAQVAIQLTHKVVAERQLPQPNQLVLLDPYFTPGVHHVNVGPDNEQVATYNFNTMRRTLAINPKLGFAIYRSTKLSEWPLGDENKPLEMISAYLRICPAYLVNANKKQAPVIEHLSCAYIYFNSKRFPAPQDFVNANSSTADIRRLMGTKRYCTITNFDQGCQSVSHKPIVCPLEQRFLKVH